MERCLKKVLQRGHSKNGDIRLLAVAVNPPNVVAPSRPEDEAREMGRRVFAVDALPLNSKHLMQSHFSAGSRRHCDLGGQIQPGAQV